jgi:uncharacterized membrane protein YeaQ/YmgE (transglycosylase-associated protein family)
MIAAERNYAMMAVQWIYTIAVGLLMGVIGQTMRVVVGLKKAKDQAASNQQSFTEVFQSVTLLVSLLIGGIAGAVAAIITVKPDVAISTETLLGLAAAGYSGADFIEGFMARFGTDDTTGPATINLGKSNISQPGQSLRPSSVPTPPIAPGPLTPFAQARAKVSPLPPL